MLAQLKADLDLKHPYVRKDVTVETKAIKMGTRNFTVCPPLIAALRVPDECDEENPFVCWHEPGRGRRELPISRIDSIIITDVLPTGETRKPIVWRREEQGLVRYPHWI